MAKTKTKGTAKTVNDTPVPQPITINSTNPKIMADNIKKLEKAIKGADDASEISYDNTDSHLTATNVQAAIDEVVSGLTSPAASDVTYDNTSSGLTADDVQDAIDEIVANDIPTTGSCTFDVTVAEGGYAEYVKSGNTVFVCYSFTISSGATSTSIVFSGLPKAKLISNLNFIPMFDDTTGVEKRVVLQNGTTSAVIKNTYGRVLENNGNYVGAFTYICE